MSRLLAAPGRRVPRDPLGTTGISRRLQEATAPLGFAPPADLGGHAATWFPPLPHGAASAAASCGGCYATSQLAVRPPATAKRRECGQCSSCYKTLLSLFGQTGRCLRVPRRIPHPSDEGPCCTCQGLFFSVTGVALLDLADVYGTDVGSVAQLVTTRGVGILAGSFFGGLLYDRLNTQLLSVLFTALTSASVFVTPSSGELLYAHGTSVLAGFSMGALDTGANVWLINLWPSGCGPVLQVYHLAFGVGAFIAPFVAEPFLSCNTSVTANTTRHGGLLIGAGTLSREPQLPFAFGIVSGFIALVATSMFVVYLVDRSDCKPSGGEQSSQPVNLVLVGLLGCYIMAYLGLECSYGQMLATFAVESDLRMTKSEAAYLTSLYFLTFTVARIGSVLWSMLAGPSCILITCQLLTAVIFTLLVVFGDSSATWLWTLSGLAGVSLAAIFAAAVSYTVQFVVMTNRLMSMVTVAASLGTMVPPLFVGLFIEKDPMMFTYVCLATALIMSAFCFAMYLVTRGRPLVTADISETQGGHVG